MHKKFYHSDTMVLRRLQQGMALVAFFVFIMATPIFAADAPSLKICLLSGSAEYDSEKSLSEFQTYLESRYQVTCYRAFGKDKGDSLPGLDALEKSDLMVVFTRRIKLPQEQLTLIRKHLNAGRAVIGIRTASHAFENFPEFDKEVLGGGYKGHHSDDPAEVQISAGRSENSLMAGVKPFPTRKLYKNAAISDDALVLLDASTPAYREPVAWIRQFHGSRIFYTSLGVPEDFAQESFRRLLANAVFWTTRRDEATLRRDPNPARNVR